MIYLDIVQIRLKHLAYAVDSKQQKHIDKLYYLSGIHLKEYYQHFITRIDYCIGSMALHTVWARSNSIHLKVSHQNSKNWESEVWGEIHKGNKFEQKLGLGIFKNINFVYTALFQLIRV